LISRLSDIFASGAPALFEEILPPQNLLFIASANGIIFLPLSMYQQLITMNFDKHTQEAHKFFNELAERLGNPDDADHAFRVAHATLHTLREILTPEESLHLISQIPMYLKAVYVDGWKLTVKDRIRSMDEFLERLQSKADRTYARDFGNREHAIQKVKAVFEQLQQYISPGEVDDILAQFPTDLADLWLPTAKMKA